jgi:hypothetical protein
VQEVTKVQLREYVQLTADEEAPLKEMAKSKGQSYETLVAKKNKEQSAATAKESTANGIVVFDHTPIVSESRTAEYANAGLPGESGVVVYTVTNNRNFSITGKFISRTIGEAAANYRKINLLRAWLIPPIGENVEASGSPPVLLLNGYGTQFYGIPVQMTEFSTSYPDDVDYIECSDYSVPIVQTVTLSLIEAHDLERVVNQKTGDTASVGKVSSAFDINAYKQGKLPGW